MKKVTVTVSLFSAAFVFSWIQSNSDNPVVAADKKMVEVGKPLQLTTDGCRLSCLVAGISSRAVIPVGHPRESGNAGIHEKQTPSGGSIV